MSVIVAGGADSSVAHGQWLRVTILTYARSCEQLDIQIVQRVSVLDNQVSEKV